MPHHIGLLLVLSLVLVVGDAFWIFHVKTSADTFTDEALDFTVLAVIAFLLVEEFGFRLWLQAYLEEKMHSYLFILFVAIPFYSFHKPTMPIPQLLSGILYGVVLLETKSIWMPVLLHALLNGILLCADQIEVIAELGYIQMDKPGNVNLYIAIAAWLLTAAGIKLCVKWSLLHDKIAF